MHCAYISSNTYRLSSFAETWIDENKEELWDGVTHAAKLGWLIFQNWSWCPLWRTVYWYTHALWALSCCMHLTFLRAHSYMGLLPFTGVGTNDYICPQQILFAILLYVKIARKRLIFVVSFLHVIIWFYYYILNVEVGNWRKPKY
jgi:hypothetical protein